MHECVEGEMARRYTVDYERDADGWWVASVPQVAGCRTQGRSLKQARERIREALAAANAAPGQIVDGAIVGLPRKAANSIAKYKGARKEAQHWAERSKVLAWKAVHQVARESGLSLRDAGELLELSHQRVQQILEEKAPPA
jgi:hypothetical protein